MDRAWANGSVRPGGNIIPHLFFISPVICRFPSESPITTAVEKLLFTYDPMYMGAMRSVLRL
jgi:hypothetical protein